jgi:hypothetical protein
LGIGPDLFAEQIQPHLRVVRVGRRKIIAITELEAWLAENAEMPLAKIAGGSSR